MLDWLPASGQVALIELAAGGEECLTGIVLEADSGAVVIDLGASPRPTGTECEVTVSFFDPDALYRIEATLSAHDGGDRIVDLAVHEIERVQRRVAPRFAVTLPVVLSNLDDPDPDGSGVLASVSGESVNISEGGCRVVVGRRCPSGCDPTVTLHLSSGGLLVALAAVLEELPLPDGRYEYRLVFTDPEDGHRELLREFVAGL